jgi:hypothetical protein
MQLSGHCLVPAKGGLKLTKLPPYPVAANDLLKARMQADQASNPGGCV